MIRAEAKTRAPADSVTPGRREATNPGSIFHRVLKRGSRVPRFARPRDDGRGWARLSPMRRMRTVRTKPLEPAEWAGQTSEDPAGSSGKYGECGLFNPAFSRGGCAPSAHRASAAPLLAVTPGRREATNPGSIFHRVLKRGSRVPRFARPRDDGRGWTRLSPIRRMRTVRTFPPRFFPRRLQAVSIQSVRHPTPNRHPGAMRSIEPGVHLSPRAAPWIPGSALRAAPG